MRMTHKINHGWAPNRNDPEWEDRVEREATATTDATERAFLKAQARLARAEEKLAAVAARNESDARLSAARRIVDARREELLAVQRLMTQHGQTSTNQGRRSHRGVPGEGRTL